MEWHHVVKICCFLFRFHFIRYPYLIVIPMLDSLMTVRLRCIHLPCTHIFVFARMYVCECALCLCLSLLHGNFFFSLSSSFDFESDMHVGDVQFFFIPSQASQAHGIMAFSSCHCVTSGIQWQSEKRCSQKQR